MVLLEINQHLLLRAHQQNKLRARWTALILHAYGLYLIELVSRKECTHPGIPKTSLNNYYYVFINKT